MSSEKVKIPIPERKSTYVPKVRVTPERLLTYVAAYEDFAAGRDDVRFTDWVRAALDVAAECGLDVR